MEDPGGREGEFSRLKKEIMDGLRKEMKEMFFNELMKNETVTPRRRGSGHEPCGGGGCGGNEGNNSSDTSTEALARTLEASITRVRSDLRLLIRKFPALETALPPLPPNMSAHGATNWHSFSNNSANLTSSGEHLGGAVPYPHSPRASLLGPLAGLPASSVPFPYRKLYTEASTLSPPPISITCSSSPTFRESLPPTTTNISVDPHSDNGVHSSSVGHSNKYSDSDDESTEYDSETEYEDREDGSSDEERVTLNVGGKIFQTLTDTILRYPSTLLAQMLTSEHFEQERREMLSSYRHKEPFFDRNPTAFEHILEW